MKIIAFYLPQFHEIPENDEWWGKGFTEWVNVKKAEPLFEGHYQPRIPLDSNYYDLLNKNTLKWQVSLARQYGVYGFCMYHYWFGGHKLLEKPVEMFLEDQTLKLPFCLCWANENWTNAWVSKKRTILIGQTYGDTAEWEEHFNYLLPFFKDSRYIKEDNKPLFVIFRPEIIECKKEMLEYWDKLAIKHGFSGMVFAAQLNAMYEYEGNALKEDDTISYTIEYQPNYASRWLRGKFSSFLKKTKEQLFEFMDSTLKTSFFSTLMFEPKLKKSNYDKLWKAILEHKPVNQKCIPGAFVDFDNTPRRQKRGITCVGAAPYKFEIYLEKLIEKTKQEYDKKDYIFIFAWNEWAEGGYIEPDEKWKYGYLEAIKNALIKSNEMENY